MVSGDSAPISSKCPKCGHSRVVSYSRSDLNERLRTGEAIEVMCITCSETWSLADKEREAVAQGLKRLIEQRVELGPEKKSTRSSNARRPRGGHRGGRG
jgi:hypothetical protein